MVRSSKIWCFLLQRIRKAEDCLTKTPIFTVDYNGFYPNQKCFIISKLDLALVAIMNSPVTMFWFKMVLPKLRGDFFEPSKIFMEQFPIPVSLDNKNELEILVKGILDNETDESTRQKNEKKANQIVYKLYSLTNKEIDLLEKYHF